MGSLEEEKLVKMVDDFIESAAETPISSSSSNSLPLTSKTHYFFTLKEILGSGRKEEREVCETVMKHLRRKRDDPKTTNLKKWLVMKLKMDGYDSSDLCHSSWVSSMGCPAGEYEYIEMKATKDEYESVGRKRLIIDIDFRAQFEVARPTQEYNNLTQTLPSVFVGTEENVSRIITLLCSAAKQSLRESGLHIPPWRTSTYMQCKWLSPHHQNNNNNYNNIHFNFGRLINENENENENENGNLISKWKPPMVNQVRKRIWGGGSALSTQFSNMSINCC